MGSLGLGDQILFNFARDDRPSSSPGGPKPREMHKKRSKRLPNFFAMVVSDLLTYT